MTTKKWIYRFGEGVFEGHSDMKDLLGNKGANLAEMADMGLPVPPGFTITTDACRDYLENEHELQDDIKSQVMTGLSWLEGVTGRQFANPANPLLVSVRSGAAQSMPGMMDSVLNLGLNDETVAQLLETTHSKRFILDCYRRLIQMYGSVVLGLDDHVFEEIILEYQQQYEIRKVLNIPESGWHEIIDNCKAAIASKDKPGFPQDTDYQFFTTIGAVFRSWYSPRAIKYRDIKELEDVGGTAVTVQSMVYGNRSDNSASGVAFTRNPSTGEAGLYGEYLPNVQGEDIVDGSHTPRSLTEDDRLIRLSEAQSLEALMPSQFTQLVKVSTQLEQRFRDMQEIEFTIEEGTLWLLQTRAAKRSIDVAIRVALDLLDDGLISQQEAVNRVPKEDFHKLTRPVIDPDFKAEIVTRGLPASPGAAAGAIVFTPQKAVSLAKKGKEVVLVRNETSPNDVAGMHAATAILTRLGGMTSHAADIARAIGRPCIVDAKLIEIDQRQAIMKVGPLVLAEGDEITIDGSNGTVLAGRVPMNTPQLDEYGRRFKALMNS